MLRLAYMALLRLALDKGHKMTITIKAKTIGLKNKPKSTGHTRPQPPRCSLDFDDARLRVSNLLSLLGVSHSTFYKGLKTGRYPSPDGKDGEMPYWRAKTVREFLEPQI